jgi:uncharacterized protein (TIGR00369 family)
VRRFTPAYGLCFTADFCSISRKCGIAASQFFINAKEQEVRGIEISANHLRSIREGVVTGTARIIHKGRTLHLWEIKLPMKRNLISLCKLTNIVAKTDKKNS